MSLGLVTAIFDDYDSLKPQYTDAQEAVCVTDNPELRADGWRMHVVKRPVGETGRMACKHSKCFPWLYLRGCHDILVTVDGSFSLQHGKIQIDQFLPQGEILGQWPNMFRRCAYEEAEASKDIDKYATCELEDQEVFYAGAGLPTQWGLWSCGIIFRRDVPRIREFEVRWFQEICRWGVQDQVSHAFVCHEMSIRPFQPEGVVTDNKFATWRGHLK
jgi:hypothetical protein